MHPVGKFTLPATTLVAEEESVTPSACPLRQQRVQPLPLVTQSPPLMLMMGLVMQLLYWPTQRNQLPLRQYYLQTKELDYLPRVLHSPVLGYECSLSLFLQADFTHGLVLRKCQLSENLWADS